MHPEPRGGCPTTAALVVPGAALALLVLQDVIFGHPRLVTVDETVLSGSREAVGSVAGALAGHADLTQNAP